MLDNVDLNENLINIERITIAFMLAFQVFCIKSIEFDAPQPDTFVTHYYPALG